MADHLKNPPNAQTETATKQPLGKSPEDRPNWGGGMGQTQTANATKVTLGKTPMPVANLENKPGMGQVQNANATTASLSRKTAAPYDHISKTNPQVDY